jgi:hypothetical protein
MADESSVDFGLASVGTEEFTGAFAAPKLAGRTSRAFLEFEVDGAPAGLFAAMGAEEVAVEVALGPVWFRGIGSGGGAVALAKFRVSCCASDCRFEEGSARFGAGAEEFHFSKTARSGACA